MGSAKLLERVVTSVPLNRVASDVTGEQGTHWTPEFGEHEHVYDAPPPMRPMISDPNLTDITGSKFGRLMVVGLSEKTGRNKYGSKWVCRCVCGTYTIRNRKGLVNHPAGVEPMCPRCDRLEHVKWAYEHMPPGDFRKK